MCWKTIPHSGTCRCKEPFIAVDVLQNTGATSLDIDDLSIHLFGFEVLMRSIRYPGAVPTLHLNTNIATLYAIPSLILASVGSLGGLRCGHIS